MYYDSTKPFTGRVLEAIRTTWDCNKSVRVRLCRGYPVVEFCRNYPLLSHTDGIGTKGYYHWLRRTFREAAVDALAMNLNDLAMYGATPVTAQNHLTLPEEDDEAVYAVIEALAAECRQFGVVMTGGETSIQNTMQGMDLSVTVTGIAPACREARYDVGDVLVGLASGGLHSNGFTLVRSLFPGECRPEFVAPTRYYHQAAEDLFHQFVTLNHITGGAFTKLRPNLSAGVDARLEFTGSPPVFWDIHRAGVSSEQMYRTFNCGYGFVVGVPAGNGDLLSLLKWKGGDVIGEVVPGSGRVVVKSAFDGDVVTY